jgi:hypothetical protein
MQIQQTEREEWYCDPVTVEFLARLKAVREETKERWAQQHFHDVEDAVKSSRLNLYALAGMDAVGQVIEMIEEARPQAQGE